MALDSVGFFFHALIPPEGMPQRSVLPQITPFTNNVYLKVSYYTRFERGRTPCSGFILRTLESSRKYIYILPCV